VPGRMSDGLASGMGASFSRARGPIKKAVQTDLIGSTLAAAGKRANTDHIWAEVSENCHYSRR